MSNVKTNMGKLGIQHKLLAALTANSAELGHLEVIRAKLAGFVGTAQDAIYRQGALAAEKQEISKQLQEALGGGERLSNVLRVTLKEHYGIRSEKLTEFGIQPFRGRSRKAKEEPNVEPAAADPTATE